MGGRSHNIEAVVKRVLRRTAGDESWTHLISAAQGAEDPAIAAIASLLRARLTPKARTSCERATTDAVLRASRRMPVPDLRAVAGPSFGREFTKSLHFQMKYVFPIIIVFISWALPSSIALYWTTSNLFMIGQELLVGRRFRGTK